MMSCVTLYSRHFQFSSLLQAWLMFWSFLSTSFDRWPLTLKCMSTNTILPLQMICFSWGGQSRNADSLFLNASKVASIHNSTNWINSWVYAQLGVEIECPLLFHSFSPKWYAVAMPPPKAPAIAMGRKPAVDLNIIPVRVAAPTELNSSSSPPRNLPIKVSKLQYIKAVDKDVTW